MNYNENTIAQHNSLDSAREAEGNADEADRIQKSWNIQPEKMK